MEEGEGGGGFVSLFKAGRGGRRGAGWLHVKAVTAAGALHDNSVSWWAPFGWRWGSNQDQGRDISEGAVAGGVRFGTKEGRG